MYGAVVTSLVLTNHISRKLKQLHYEIELDYPSKQLKVMYRIFTPSSVNLNCFHCNIYVAMISTAQ